jgi:hypothetical protein
MAEVFVFGIMAYRREMYQPEYAGHTWKKVGETLFSGPDNHRPGGDLIQKGCGR